MKIKNFKITDTLKNGTFVTIRAVRPEDKEMVLEAFKNLEPRTIYTRFFRYKNELTDEELKSATEIDFEDEVGLVVTTQNENKDIIIAGARYWVLKTDGEAPLRAEIAFTVEEDYQGQGIAGRLLQHLARIAREKGISYFEAEVLSQNKAMLTVFERSGLPLKKRNDDGEVHITMSLAETDV